MNQTSTAPVWQTIVATVENKPGVLARVAGLFSRRGFNIHSLAVAPTDDERFSRITFTVDVEGTPLDQVVKQLDKLVNVVDIQQLDPSESIERELILIAVEVGDRAGHLQQSQGAAGGEPAAGDQVFPELQSIAFQPPDPAELLGTEIPVAATSGIALLHSLAGAVDAARLQPGLDAA